jgi:hypothetical protein
MCSARSSARSPAKVLCAPRHSWCSQGFPLPCLFTFFGEPAERKRSHRGEGTPMRAAVMSVVIMAAWSSSAWLRYFCNKATVWPPRFPSRMPQLAVPSSNTIPAPATAPREFLVAHSESTGSIVPTLSPASVPSPLADPPPCLSNSPVLGVSRVVEIDKSKHLPSRLECQLWP